MGMISISVSIKWYVIIYRGYKGYANTKHENIVAFSIIFNGLVSKSVSKTPFQRIFHAIN